MEFFIKFCFVANQCQFHSSRIYTINRSWYKFMSSHVCFGSGDNAAEIVFLF